MLQCNIVHLNRNVHSRDARFPAEEARLDAVAMPIMSRFVTFPYHGSQCMRLSLNGTDLVCMHEQHYIRTERQPRLQPNDFSMDLARLVATDVLLISFQ